MADIHVDHVAKPIESYLQMAESWRLPQALMGGTRQMQKEGRTYLPQWEREDNDEYAKRLKKSVLYNGFRKSVYGLTGRIFAKPIQIGDDVPEKLINQFENIDLTGRNLQVFARDLMIDSMAFGLSHILIEAPKIKPKTLREESETNWRPYWRHIKAHDLIGWRAKFINGVFTLTQVRFRETYLKAAGLYAEIPIDRVWVLTPGYYEVWDAIDANGNASSEYQMVESGETGLSYIPLVTNYTNRIGHMLAQPPLEDLAFLNLQHWQSSSDQFQILHIARVPLLHFKGFPSDFGKAEEEASINNAFVGPADSDVKYVEHQGSAIKAGAENISDLEEKMQIMGMQMLVPKTGGVTATENALDAAETNSELQTIALNLQDTLETAMAYTADIMGDGWDNGGSLTVNTDFGVGALGSADLKLLINMRLNKQITRETLWREAKRRGVLMDHFDEEAEASLLDGEVDEQLPEGLDLGGGLAEKLEALISGQRGQNAND